MVTYELLPASERRRFRPLTFPAYRALLAESVHPAETAGDGGRTVAMGATLLGRPTGLALARRDGGAGGTLLSLYVDPKARGRGIGRRLVAELEAELRRRGCERLDTVYMLSHPGIAAFERVLERSGWEAPRTRSHSLRFTLDQARQVPWFGKYELHPRYRIFPWRELTDTDRQRLVNSQEESPWIPPDLVPWTYDRDCEPISSLGLRDAERDGEVVGWVINHQISGDTLRMTCAFVRREIQGLAKILPLFSESLELARRTTATNVTCVTSVDYPEMLHFFRRWCLPWANALVETREAAKRLASRPGLGAGAARETEAADRPREETPA